MQARRVGDRLILLLRDRNVVLKERPWTTRGIRPIERVARVGFHYARFDREQSSAECAFRSKRSCERVADEEPLPWPLHGLPIRLHQCISREIPLDQDRRIRELLGVVAWLYNSAIASRSTCCQPLKRAHLSSIPENSRRRGERIAHRPRKE